MRWPFRSRQTEMPAGDEGEAPAATAERPLRLLIAASIVLPILIFTGVSWIAYERHFEDARNRLDVTLGQVYEHALKVFETFELVARYTDELFDDVSNDQITANEAEYHARLRALTDTLPQLRDIWVIDSAGRPLVSGTIIPMPRLDLSDREYFVVQRNRQPGESYVSEEFQSRAADRRVFLISRRRVVTGHSDFQGIMTTAIAPEYFTEYYSRLPLDQSGMVALVRADGVVLARYPEPAGAQGPLEQGAGMYRAVASAPDHGFYTSVSPVDGVKRMIAYRKLPRHPVYVVSVVETRSIVREWMMQMGNHLVFGIPATVTMVLLSLVALRHTRREAHAYARLRQEVARRETTEQALRQAQKMEAIGRLTGGIAHDFNNLLTAILGNVDLALLRLGANESRLHRYLSAARDASHRAATLVNRLLAFSRQHPLEVKLVDVNRLVQGMSELLRRTIGETITIETVLAGGLWKAAVDPNQLESAILNLAVNAKDAMPDGGRLIIETANAYFDDATAAAAASDVKPGQYVMVAVTDTGTGMTKEVVEHAFEPFFTTKPTGLGTGLGLSMVYGFVKQSGGHVKIDSEVGEGTTIKLYFPRSTATRALHRPDEIEPAEVPTGDATETVLLVEDDEEVNRFAADVLRDLGYRVHSAPDGPTALRLVRENADIDLLFTDVVLPGGMNGRELAEAARRERPRLKVLFATGYTSDAIIHQGRLDANVELLTKPFTYEALARKVRQVLDAEPARDESAEPEVT